MGCTGSKKARISTELTLEQIVLLADNTKLTEKKIREWHASFISDCPSGKLNEQELVTAYKHFYPDGKVEAFCKYVFAAIDANNDGTIDFTEYLLHIAALSQNNLDDQLEVAFELYDISGNGHINQKQLANLISAIYDLIGETDRKGDRDPKKRAAEIMVKLDMNGDKKLSKSEFIAGCKNNSVIRRILALRN